MLLDGIVTLLTNGPNPSGGVHKDVLARGYSFPAIVVHRYGGHQDYEFSGASDVTEDQVQIDVYGNTADERDELAQQVRALLVEFTGELPDGTVVNACYLERDMDMPFLPQANQLGTSFRSILGFRIVRNRV